MVQARSPRLSDAKQRPEAELLLCCARLTLEQAGRDRVLQLLQGRLDWAALIGLAAQHGLRPLLYRHLNALAPAALPKQVLVQLWVWYERTSRHNRSMAQELLRILRLFDSNGIAAIPYKGPALAASLYGDLSLREFGDLDLLLRPRDIAPAKALLLAQGYRAEYCLQPALEAALLRSKAHYHFALVHDSSGLMVELHWMTDIDFPVEPVAEDRWWQQVGRAGMEQGEVRCFAVRELLLILCLHGSKHHWASMGWLVDVAELIRAHPRTDWDWLMAKARQLRCERRLALGLHLAQQLLDAPLPQKVREQIAGTPAIDDLSATVARMLFDPELEAMNALETLSLDLKLYDSYRQRLGHALNVVFAPSLPEWSRWPLPRALFFLHYPLRLIRLAGKYGLLFLDRKAPP
jgi:hypothetical protein